jgi:hypothetical protein
LLALLVPPPANAFDRKGRRIVIDAHIDPTAVALQIRLFRPFDEARLVGQK